MADIADIANDHAQWRLDRALEAQLLPLCGPALDFCMDCGDAIPERRRQIVRGCTRCANCQSYAEHQEARHAR
jgi:phage/conjugal plasmid C-4 type zinc finger TraR family protein